ncbi:MAG: hypothetical protein K2J04_04000 [Lachnospiraceae bacterium]|nr:hypothetical protein [Lachnospiraceae bacterium]
MLHNEMIEKLKNDSIKNEELLDCLNSKNFNIVGQAIYKIMERRYCDEDIIKALTKTASMLNGYKVIGPYQMGHLAIAALFLVEDKSALEYFNQIYNNLDSNDKFLVDNFIKNMQLGAQ